MPHGEVTNIELACVCEQPSVFQASMFSIKKGLFYKLWWVATISPLHLHQQKQPGPSLEHASQNQRIRCQQGVGLYAAAPEAAAGLPAVPQPVAVTAFVRPAQQHETYWAPLLAAVLVGAWVW